MKQAIIFGNNQDAMYHPLCSVKDCFDAALSPAFIIEYSEEWIDKGHLNNYDLCVIYYDQWNSTPPATVTIELESFIANGGGLLVVHNGISLQKDHRFCELIGAKFLSHPERQKIRFNVLKKHPITRDIQSFEVIEELYHFEYHGIEHFTVLMEGRLMGTASNALWVKQDGHGRIAYFSIGHDRDSLTQETVRCLLYNTAQWCATMI